MLDWLIVGGGPHGIHLACRLLDRGVAREKVAILDPHAEPLARWQHHTHNAGMLYLRSPKVHHLDVDPLSLEHFAETDAFIAAKRRANGEGTVCERDFIPPYDRPSLHLFMQHVKFLIETNDLMRCWRSARATSLRPLEQGYGVQTDAGEQIEARNLVLALGSGDHLNWPPWAVRFNRQKNQAKIRHIFASDFNRECIPQADDVAIIGAGISAAQLALALHETNPKRRIFLISRHFLRKQDFDSDPGWLGPTLLNAFHRETCYTKRRAAIREARHVGSLAAEVTDRLQEALQQDRGLQLEVAKVSDASLGPTHRRLQLHLHPFELDLSQYDGAGDLVFRFSNDVKILEADTVVLATGFESGRPGGAFLDAAIQRMKLPTASDGYPIVDRHLRWRNGLFVMGPLAELEIGPAARNLSGARMAADRIVHGLRAQESTSLLASCPAPAGEADEAEPNGAEARISSTSLHPAGQLSDRKTTTPEMSTPNRP